MGLCLTDFRLLLNYSHTHVVVHQMVEVVRVVVVVKEVGVQAAIEGLVGA